MDSRALGVPVPESSSQAVSSLLAKWQAGDEEAMQVLLPIVYDELRRIAHRYMRKEKPGHTLQSTALVHEAWVRLIQQQRTNFENRAHFLAICAQLMRQILVEYARSRRAAKRDGGYRICLDDPVALANGRSVDLLYLDDALSELARLDSQQSRVVELRFFTGLSIEETAHVLRMSPATVKRHWVTARIWLHREISRSSKV